MEELEQPRRCQASGRECTSTEGPTNVNWNDIKHGCNHGHIRLQGSSDRAIQPRNKEVDSTREV
eukprot:11273391-Prorocentrum_lima.AAC.1